MTELSPHRKFIRETIFAVHTAFFIFLLALMHYGDIPSNINRVDLNRWLHKIGNNEKMLPRTLIQDTLSKARKL